MNQSFKCNVIFALFWLTSPIFTEINVQSQPTKIEFLQITAEDETYLQQAEEVFIKAFSKAYKDVSLATLKIENLNSFLKEAFNDAIIDLKNPQKNLSCFVATKDNKVIGVIFFAPTKQVNEVYIAQLAVDPAMQRFQIGTKLMDTVIQTYPQTKKIVLTTRKINEEARAFYTKSGFTLTTQVFEGYNPERYMSFEKKIK